MQAKAIVTLAGPDRVGIVDDVTGALFDLEANVETSRMARLGGAFAVLMLVTLPAERFSELESALAQLTSEGYTLCMARAEEEPKAVTTRSAAYRIDVSGADHEGIIHDIAHGLSTAGINIESMETSTSHAPVSGSPLFSMRALVAVPPTVAESDWRAALAEAGHQANVDVDVSAVEDDTLQ